MFSFLSKKKYREETALVFIVESGKIISAIIKYDDSNLPEIIFSQKSNIDIEQTVDPVKLQEAVLAKLSSTAESILKDQLAVLKISNSHSISIHIFLGSLWCVTKKVGSEYIKEKEFFISEDLIMKISKEDPPNSDTEVMIEKKVVSIKANGYNIETPLNQRANELMIVSLVSTSPKIFIDEVEKKLLQYFPKSKIDFHTTAVAIFPVAKLLAKKQDFIVFIPEHEVSDIIVARKGSVDRVVSVPYGKNSPVRDLSMTFKGSAGEAHSILTLYMADKLEEDKRKNVSSFLDESKIKFQNYLRDALRKLSSTIFLPEDIVLSNNSVMTKLIGEWIHTEEFTSKTMTIKSFNVSFMENKDIINEVTIRNKSNYVNPILISVVLYLKSN